MAEVLLSKGGGGNVVLNGHICTSLRKTLWKDASSLLFVAQANQYWIVQKSSRDITKQLSLNRLCYRSSRQYLIITNSMYAS